MGCVQARVSEWSLSTLSSPIPELQHAPLPFKVLWARERAPTSPFSTAFYLGSHLSPLRSWECVMYAQVQDIITRCEQCDRGRTFFSSRQLTLSPLPIQGMFYHWSCDLAGELPQTSRGNVYIMTMIEHFSKWVELVVLPDKSSRSTSQIFLQQVLNRFGACAECLTDQGSEFKGEFQDLLDHALIDHRWTSRDHPQADGLVERMVETCKKGLRKICLTKNKED